MLHFFKKQGRSDSNHEDNSLMAKQRICKRHSAHEVICGEPDLDETLAQFHSGINAVEQQSRLSKNLQAILADKNCLSYFVQFLDEKKALSPLKFYLDSESFKTAADLISRSTTTVNGMQTSQQKCDNCDSANEYCSTVLQVLQGTQRAPRGVAINSNTENYKDSLPTNKYEVCDKMSNCSQSECNFRVASLFNISDSKMEETAIESNCDKVPQATRECHLSMEKSLTDDEKSRIRVENSRRNIHERGLTEIANDGLVHSSSLDEKTTLIVSDKSIVNEAIRIYKKYLITNSPCFISIPSSILSNISLALCGQTEEGKTKLSIASNCFEEAQKYVLNELERKHLNEFLESVFYCRYCVNILTNGSLSLTDILYSESALFYFTEYLEQEGKRNYLAFWMAATNFRKHYKSRLQGEFSKTEAQNDAMILYDKYFSLQASYPLRISDSVRSQIEESICADNEGVVACFDLAIQIIEGYLNKKYFNCFLESLLFENYLKELQVKIGNDKKNSAVSSKNFNRPGHRKTLSDCTTDKASLARRSSISQYNTLLAMETANPRLKVPAANVSGNDMQIDSKQLTDPDLLWQREKASATNALTFGRVDSLGRYERDFEPSHSIEDKWSLSAGGSRLKNAVRKLVNLPEDSVQEEIAWQVAEMIVKDVTNITLGNMESNSS